MFKKFNSRLLTHYPLVWNTKIVWVLAIAFVIHLFYFLSGFSESFSLTNLFYLNLEDSTIVFSILISMLFLILWLVFYLRNNAFQQHYPFSRGKLTGEFFLVFLAVTVSISFFESNLYGQYSKVRWVSSNVDFEKEANIVNLANFFLPFSEYEFEIQNSCDSIERKAQVRYGERVNYDDFVVLAEELKDDSVSQLKSYLYYCQNIISCKTGRDVKCSRENRNIADSWLLNRNRDSIEMAISDYLELFPKYGAKHDFDIQQHINSIFSDPEFSHINIISRNNSLFEDLIVANSLCFINKSRQPYFTHTRVIVWLYFIFMISLLIFSFRIVRKKEWFIALIGSGVIAVAIILVNTLVFPSDFENGLLLAAILIALVSILSIHFIYSKEHKSAGGVLLVWTTVFGALFIPLLLFFISSKDRYFYNYEYRPFIYGFVKDNIHAIQYLNFALVLFLLSFIIIPLAFKWQGNPEE